MQLEFEARATSLNDRFNSSASASSYLDAKITYSLSSERLGCQGYTIDDRDALFTTFIVVSNHASSYAG
jgi:hypothetical protein